MKELLLWMLEPCRWELNFMDLQQGEIASVTHYIGYFIPLLIFIFRFYPWLWEPSLPIPWKEVEISNGGDGSIRKFTQYPLLV